MVTALLSARVFFYESRSFSKGIDTALLERASESLLQPLLRLDGRGGFFAQDDVEYGLNMAFKADEVKTLVEEQATEMGCSSTAAFVTLASYVTRLMLNHLRIKRRAYLKLESDQQTASRAHPESLVAAYDLFTDQKETGKKRKCPFINFRKEESDEDEENDDDQGEADDGDVGCVPKTVLKYFDTKLKKAMRLLSNGKSDIATEHIPGSDGFIVARWMDPIEEYSLDLPNACLDSHGGIVEAKTTLPFSATHPGRKEDAEGSAVPAAAEAELPAPAEPSKETSGKKGKKKSKAALKATKATAKAKAPTKAKAKATAKKTSLSSKDTPAEADVLQVGSFAIMHGLEGSTIYNEKACIIIGEKEDSPFPRWTVKVFIDDFPAHNIKAMNLRAVSAKEAAKNVHVKFGDFSIRGTPQGMADSKREPLFLVHHEGVSIGSVIASSKHGRSLFDAFEIAIKACNEIQESGNITRDSFLESRNNLQGSV